MVKIVSDRIKVREDREKQLKQEQKKIRQWNNLDLSEFDKRNIKTLISSQPAFIKSKFCKYAQVKFDPQ